MSVIKNDEEQEQKSSWEGNNKGKLQQTETWERTRNYN